jgi:hypothetical protein
VSNTPKGFTGFSCKDNIVPVGQGNFFFFLLFLFSRFVFEMLSSGGEEQKVNLPFFATKRLPYKDAQLNAINGID